MSKYEKIFSALSKAFDVCALNEQIDEFEGYLNSEGLKIIEDVSRETEVRPMNGKRLTGKEREEWKIAWWNKKYKPGQEVLVRTDKGLESNQTTSEAFLFQGHTAMVSLEEIGDYDLDCVIPLKE